jgi:hypothetical protein
MAAQRAVTKELSGSPAHDAESVRQASPVIGGKPPPSLTPREKYDEARDIWRSRVNRKWRFYFTIAGDTYDIEDVIAHPK